MSSIEVKGCELIAEDLVNGKPVYTFKPIEKELYKITIIGFSCEFIEGEERPPGIEQAKCPACGASERCWAPIP